jgi:hypothetical protein
MEGAELRGLQKTIVCQVRGVDRTPERLSKKTGEGKRLLSTISDSYVSMAGLPGELGYLR